MAYLTGFHAIEEAIKAGKLNGTLLVANAGPRARSIMAMAVERKIPTQRVGEHELDRLARGHRGIALKIESGEENNDIDLENYLQALAEEASITVLVLDGITDPHNYGAILRSADQFGVDLVVVGKRRSAKDAEIVSRTSAGAVSWVRIAAVPNLTRAVEQLKEAGFWVYGADMTGKAAASMSFPKRTTLILGSEGSGLSRLLERNCDGLVSIPTYGRVDSLNVSVAAGVLLYEIAEQRGGRKPR